MKRLNKKGFTLVELLAVIVILALLIVVVANTALPAMNNAKKNTLDTYAKRVVEQAKTMYISDNNLCAKTPAKACDLVTLMGPDAPKDQYMAGLYTKYSATGGYLVYGWVIDIKNENIRKVSKGKTSEGKCSDISGNGADTACAQIATCKWDSIDSKCGEI